MPTLFNPTRSDLIDLSIIPSYFCNLKCPFCMYSCSSEYKGEIIDLEKLIKFTFTIDWNKINSIGLYGGEISLYIPVCNSILNMFPESIPKFCITNGTWSRSEEKTERFISFCKQRNIKIVVSSTYEHRRFQNHDVIAQLWKNGDIIWKRDDTLDKMNPMGRLWEDNWTCEFKCKNINKPKRFAICPDGNIIFQSCDGCFPVVSDYTKNFNSLEIKCKRRKDLRYENI